MDIYAYYRQIKANSNKKHRDKKINKHHLTKMTEKKTC